MQLRKYLFLLICWSAFFPNAYADNISFTTAPLSIVTKQGTVHFTVEVALTQEQQELGLMFRKSLPDFHGMIFNFSKPRHIDMWMKNTLIPLDMVFINDKGIITQIVADAKPESTDIIASDQDTAQVLELAGGEAERYHVAIGDKVLYSRMP